MNCQEFWDHLPQPGPDFSRDCSQDFTEAQSSHVAECQACKTQLAARRALAAGLRSTMEDWRKIEAPARVEAGLMAAFRTQMGSRSRQVARPPWWAPVFAWASAAAAMVALGAALIHGYQPTQGRPGTVAAPRHSSQTLVETAAFTDSDADDESVLGEGFVRLPNAPRIEPNEDFNVVRVEVPGSAIIAMGVSMSEDRARENVVADVALASDGTARAVRLVSDGGTY